MLQFWQTFDATGWYAVRRTYKGSSWYRVLFMSNKRRHMQTRASSRPSSQRLIARRHALNQMTLLAFGQSHAPRGIVATTRTANLGSGIETGKHSLEFDLNVRHECTGMAAINDHALQSFDGCTVSRTMASLSMSILTSI